MCCRQDALAKLNAPGLVALVWPHVCRWHAWHCWAGGCRAVRRTGLCARPAHTKALALRIDFQRPDHWQHHQSLHRHWPTQSQPARGHRNYVEISCGHRRDTLTRPNEINDSGHPASAQFKRVQLLPQVTHLYAETLFGILTVDGSDLNMCWQCVGSH